ncbi:hypothetical protein F4778DRAFT_127738 [Xylariomycetidae sp. FL2044]|nr:hypothetical protein F4778DRAFT_127738 [Xylariomycetidae sp. FL2044]
MLYQAKLLLLVLHHISLLVLLIMCVLRLRLVILELTTRRGGKQTNRKSREQLLQMITKKTDARLFVCCPTPRSFCFWAHHSHSQHKRFLRVMGEKKKRQVITITCCATSSRFWYSLSQLCPLLSFFPSNFSSLPDDDGSKVIAPITPIGSVPGKTAPASMPAIYSLRFP